MQWLGNMQWVVEARVPIWQLIVKWPDYLFILDCSELDTEIIKYVNTQLIISGTRVTKLFEYYFYCVVIISLSWLRCYLQQLHQLPIAVPCSTINVNVSSSMVSDTQSDIYCSYFNRNYRWTCFSFVSFSKKKSKTIELCKTLLSLLWISIKKTKKW